MFLFALSWQGLVKTLARSLKTHSYVFLEKPLMMLGCLFLFGETCSGGLVRLELGLVPSWLRVLGWLRLACAGLGAVFGRVELDVTTSRSLIRQVLQLPGLRLQAGFWLFICFRQSDAWIGVVLL